MLCLHTPHKSIPLAHKVSRGHQSRARWGWNGAVCLIRFITQCSWITVMNLIWIWNNMSLGVWPCSSWSFLSFPTLFPAPLKVIPRFSITEVLCVTDCGGGVYTQEAGWLLFGLTARAGPACERKQTRHACSGTEVRPICTEAEDAFLCDFIRATQGLGGLLVYPARTPTRTTCLWIWWLSNVGKLVFISWFKSFPGRAMLSYFIWATDRDS